MINTVYSEIEQETSVHWEKKWVSQKQDPQTAIKWFSTEQKKGTMSIDI